MEADYLKSNLNIGRTTLRALYLGIMCLITFSISAQPVNDHCETATQIPFLGIPFNCLEDSIDGADPDPLQDELFDVSAFPTVWYSFWNFDDSPVNIHFRSESIDWPVLRLFRKSSTCENLIPVEWIDGVDGKAEWIGLELASGEYVLAVTSIDTKLGSFTLCMNNLAEVLPVRQMKVSSPKVEWREYGGPLEGPFFQGELLNLSTTVSQRQDAQGSCSWFQGLIPVFGQSWSEEAYYNLDGNSTLNGLPMGQAGNGHFGASTWDWFTYDVNYHKYSDHLKTAYFDDQLYTGLEGLKSTLFDPFVQNYANDIFGGCCPPCWDPDPGEQLPAGWFCYGTDGSCSIPGPPIRYDWGDGESCNPTNREWTFSFSMSVNEDIAQCETDGDIDLTIAMFPFMDNTVGSWSDNTDGIYDAYGFKRLPVVCDIPWILPGTIYPDTLIEACFPDSIVLPLQLLGSHLDHVAFWKYALNGPFGTAPFSGITPDDTLILFPPPHGHNAFKYDGWIQAFSDPRHLIDRFYVIFRFYKRPPTAEIEEEIINGQVHFSQTTPVGEVASIFWDFGDSTTSNAFRPIHQYEKEGPYTVTLIETNPCGSDTLVEEIVYVKSLPNPLIANSRSNVCRGDTITYTSISTGYIDSLHWFFEGGDPPYANDSIVSVVYAAAGTFDVALSAFNPLGVKSLHWQDSVKVQDLPVATFYTSESDSLLYCIYAGDLSDVVAWQVDVGPLIENDTLIIDNEGFHLITLIVSNSCGSDTLRDGVLFIQDIPKPLFTVTDYELCRSDTIVYTSISTGWIDSLAWVFEGGSPGSSNDSIVKVTYPEIGSFDVSLTAFNVLGEATKMIENSVIVQDPPIADYSVAIFDSLYFCIYKGPEADAVYWQFNDEEIISQDTLVLIVEQSGVYPIRLWVENGCGVDSVFFSLHILVTATEGIEARDGILLYPNPSNGSLWMVTDHLEFPASIHIYDCTGRLTWTYAMTPETKLPFEMELNQMGLSPGTYLLELREDNRSQVRRFIKL
jgi:PKD repeat protein